MPDRRHLFLLKELVKRDFQARYAGSLLTFVWSFVQPLWMLGLFVFVFSIVLELRFEEYDLGTESFGIFLFCGLLPWMAIQEGLQRSSTAITDNAQSVKKLPFPAVLLVLSTVSSALVHEAIAVVAFLAVLLPTGELSWSTLPWLLPALVLQTVLTLGLALLVSALHVFFRDTAQVLGMALTGWFYFTPIVYPLAMVPERLRPWIELNPLTAVVDLYRVAFLGGKLEAGMGRALLVGAGGVVVLAAGWWLFRRLEPAFADEI